MMAESRVQRRYAGVRRVRLRSGPHQGTRTKTPTSSVSKLLGSIQRLHRREAAAATQGRNYTCLRNLGLTWMLALTVSGSGLMGHAGSTEFTRTSSAYSFFRGKTSSHVERNLNRLFLVFSSTYKQRTGLGPQLPAHRTSHVHILKVQFGENQATSIITTKHPALQLAAVQTKVTNTSKQQQQYLNGMKKNCTFSKTHINEVIRFLANTARYSPPTFFTMESTKYKTGSFSADGAWSNRELNKFRTQQGLKIHFRAHIRTQRSTGA